MYGGGGGDSSGALRKEQRAREEQLRQGTQAIDRQFSSFGPGFYDARAKAYERFALPTLADEYQRANQGLGYRMAGQGLFRSSVNEAARANLGRTVSQQKRSIADEGIRQGQALRGEVEQNRSNLLNQLYATNNPSLAQSQAIAAASNFSSPSPFAPVGGFLNDWSNIYLARRLGETYGPVTEQANQRRSVFGAPMPSTTRTIK